MRCLKNTTTYFALTNKTKRTQFNVLLKQTSMYFASKTPPCILLKQTPQKSRIVFCLNKHLTCFSGHPHSKLLSPARGETGRILSRFVFFKIGQQCIFVKLIKFVVVDRWLFTVLITFENKSNLQFQYWANEQICNSQEDFDF